MTVNADQSVLLEALELVHGARNAAYGPPWEDYDAVADIAGGALRVAEHPVEAQVRMVAVKLARLGHGVRQLADGDLTAAECHAMVRDSLVDLCGYADCIDRTLAHLTQEDPHE